MTEVNPNIAIQDEPVADAQPGEAVDFNQLDLITDEQIKEEQEAKSVKDEAVEKKVAAKKEEAASEESDEETSKTDDIDVKAATGIDEKAAEVKLIKVKNGTEGLDLAHDTMIPVKIDGQKTEVTLQEVINNYSGKTNWDKKYNELHQERSKFEEELKYINNNINKFYEITNEDPMMGIEYMAALAGKDPVEIGNKFRESLNSMMTEYNNLDEHGKKEYELNRKIKHYERREKLETDKKEEERQKAEASERQNQVASKYGLDTEEYESVTRKMISNDLVKGNPSPEQVVEYQRSLLVADLMMGVSPKLLENTEAYNDLVDVALQNPTMDKQDLDDIIQEVYASEYSSAASVNLSRKVRKTQADPKPAKSKSKTEAWSFDQI